MTDSLMALRCSCVYLITGHIAISRMFSKCFQWFGNDATRSIIFSGGRMNDELFVIIGIKHTDMAEATVIDSPDNCADRFVALPENQVTILAGWRESKGCDAGERIYCGNESCH